MAVIKSGTSTDQLTIDATSKAARATLYDTTGQEKLGQKTMSASIPVVIASDQTSTVMQNWALEVARGNIPGMTIITKFGYNADIDTPSAEDVFGQGGTYVPPSIARIHNLSSSSANDAAAGTGARTCLIRGIDINYNAVSETVILNGTSNVPTVNSYYHIHLMQITTVGSTGSNVGTISATAQTDATVTCTIEPTNNQSTSSIYMVPAGYKGYIMKVRARMADVTANASANVDLLIQPFGGGYQLKTRIGLNNSGSSSAYNDYSNSTPFIVQAKSFIKLRCSSVSVNNTEIMGEYDLILIAD